jgi:hypothetical protein
MSVVSWLDPSKSTPPRPPCAEVRRNLPPATAQNRKDKNYPFHLLLTGLNEVDLKDPPGRGAVHIWPVRVDPGVAPNQLAVMHGEAVRIAGTGQEIHCFQRFAGSGLVTHQTRMVLAVSGTVIPDNLPDTAVVPGDIVVAVAVRSLVERDDKFGLPRDRVQSLPSCQSAPWHPPPSFAGPSGIWRWLTRREFMST